MKKVYCDICDKEIDTVYEETIFNNKIVQVCHRCNICILQPTKKIKEQKQDNRR